MIPTDGHTGKVVVVNVWQSTCSPCRAEAADLARASRDTRDMAVFIGLDVRDQQSAAVAFSRAHGTNYAQIFDPDGKQLLKFADTLPVSAVPSTLLIDPNGLTAARILGPVTRSTLTRLIGDIYAGR